MSPVTLVTGATGFAGGHLVECLADAGGTLVGWGRSQPAPELTGLATWQTVDLLDRRQVREAIATLRPTAIYHLAGAPQVAESWRDTAKPLEGNVLSTSHLLDAVRRARLECRVLVAGSAAVYASSNTPLTEDARLAPGNPYALSKLAQEQLALKMAADDGLEILVARPFNHTGPRQAPAFVAPGFARQIALAEHGAIEPIIRVGNLEAVRDFTDVRDVVRAYVALMAHGRPGTIYNVGSGTGRTIQSVLDALLTRSTAAIQVEIDAARLRPAETSALVADTSRLAAATGWTPRIPFDQTLDDLLEYWRTEARSTA